MASHDSIRAVKRFMTDCGTKEGIEISTAVDVYDNGDKIHTGEAGVVFSYSYGYGQYSVSILWCFDDYVMRKLGLHGTYNTNFQRFSYSDGSLIILDDRLEIIISKGEKC